MSRLTDQSSDSPSMVFKPDASASLDMQILRPYFRPTQSEIQGDVYVLTRSLGNQFPEACSSLSNT